MVKITAQPILTGKSEWQDGKDYYEQIMLRDTKGFPFALAHIDAFWMGKDRDNEIHERLSNGETLGLVISLGNEDD